MYALRNMCTSVRLIEQGVATCHCKNNCVRVGQSTEKDRRDRFQPVTCSLLTTNYNTLNDLIPRQHSFIFGNTNGQIEF